MGRLGTFVVVGALAAPLGGTGAADPPSALPPSSIARPDPKFFDLTGWYTRVDAGAAWRRWRTARAASAQVGALVQGYGAGAGHRVATHWPRADATGKAFAVGAGGSGLTDLGAWSVALPVIDTGRWNSGWPAAATRGQSLARRFMRDVRYRARAPAGAERAVFRRPTFNNHAVQQVRFGMRWSSDHAVLTK